MSSSLVVVAAALTLVACQVRPEEPLALDPTSALELRVPLRLSVAENLEVVARVNGAYATAATELTYGLAEGYPRQLTVRPAGFAYAFPACDLSPGQASWTTLTGAEGNAATLALSNGVLAVELKEEGVVSALIEGQLSGLMCQINGQPVTSLPLRQQLTLHVRQVAGLVVEQFNQYQPGCHEKLVLPIDSWHSVPTVRALTATGEPFRAANAPQPATLRVFAESGGIVNATTMELAFRAGRVTVAVDSQLPVSGLRELHAVGPDAVTQVEPTLLLNRATLKGSTAEPIEEGGSYPLYLPDQINTVEPRADSAMTRIGALCGAVPPSWFQSTSLTPEVCAPTQNEADDDDVSGAAPVKILGPGECRVDVTMSGTANLWRARFTTTR